MSSNGSGIAAPSTTFPHSPWCDPSKHDDGTTHPIPDADWQICFSTPRTLEFSDRDNASATIETVTAELSFSHTDVWGERADILAGISLNQTDSILLTPDQLLPIANLLLALDAQHKGDTASANAFMAQAQAGVVEIEVDTEREAHREAARRAWAAQAEAEAAAERAEDARRAEAIAKAWRAVAKQQSEAGQYWALADIHQSEASDPNATPEQQAVARAAYDDAVRCAQAAEGSGR